MSRWLKWSMSLSGIGLVGFLAAPLLENWWRNQHPSHNFKVKKVTTGDLAWSVNATGTVTPVLTVRVGSFVSGPVIDLKVDYNKEVKKNDVLAVVDPVLYEATRDRDRAAVALAEADVARITAQLQQAQEDARRARSMRSRNAISTEETQKLHANVQALEAQQAMVKAQVKQAKANLTNSEKNLEYTRITSPVDGVVIDRKIEIGQTLAAQFMIPDLFLVAQDLRKEIHIYATIDEADVAHVQKAQELKNPVTFTVDAHPEVLFHGKVKEIRLNPITKENVVTYTVVVTTSNADLQLLPGMTAKLSIQIEKKANILKIPNAALRFYPKEENVHEDDRHILKANEEESTVDDGTDKTADNRSADQRARDRQESAKRYVWVVDARGKLRAKAIEAGIGDYKFTELKGGGLEVDEELVIGLKK